MRVISGKHKGFRFNPPKNLPYRPTTDIAKSGLFNIIHNNWYFENKVVLDLFSGTGSITYEFASRGTTDITSVDLHPGCVKYLKDNIKKLGIEGVRAYRDDAFKFIAKYGRKADIIFAGPPYPLEKQIPSLPELVFEHEILKEEGWLIVETNHLVDLENHPKFSFKRNYGTTVFNFFEWNPKQK